MRAFFVVTIALVAGTLASAQQFADPYSTGMTLWNPDGCPIFIGEVIAGSPAERAGIRPGDHLLAVDGKRVTEGSKAAELLRSNSPTTVTLTLLRDGKEVKVLSERVKRSSLYTNNIGYKMISGRVVPTDTTQAEVEHANAFDDRRIVARVFPTHYPANPEVFYAGFEIFVLRDPSQIAVGGIEAGPASKAGVHWGDVLISVNGVPTGKTPSELEQLFAATQPAPMRLEIDRLGETKTFEFHLEKASEIARLNGHRFVAGRPVPIWATGHDVQCFLQ